MIRESIEARLKEAVDSLAAKGKIPQAAYPAPVVQEPKQAEHGDLATSFALSAAKLAGAKPLDLANALKEELEGDHRFTAIEIAGPGFLNFRLNPVWAAGFIPSITASTGLDPRHDASHYAHSAKANPERINVEHVSVNPNGPITIGSGRGAAFGSALCSVLQAAGDVVHREYYINDGVNSEQMRLFAESVRSYVLGLPFPEKGYRGDYVQDVAARLKDSHPGTDASITEWQRISQELMLAKQKEDLEAFRTRFDTWFSEQSIHDSGVVASCVAGLEKEGVADEEPVRNKVIRKKNPATGKMEESMEQEAQPMDEDDAEGVGATLWLRSTKFGDDQDRVLRRRDGRLTYIASDAAYHRDKYNRPENGTKLITVLGPDHHGYIGRLRAVIAALFRGPVESPEANAQALETAKKKLDVVIFQIVRFLMDGKPAPMRKRDGNIYAIIDLIREIGEKIKPEGTEEEKLGAGADVARFFYLMRSHETAFDFDLDLAQKQSDDNPVFYVQYAHARICSVLEKAAASEMDTSGGFDPERLIHERELALLLKICDLPGEIRRTAEDYAVNRLATYAIELARTFHFFYDACRVILPEDPALGTARLELCKAARVALKAVLDILDISAPERMERAEQPT